jgi:hypothetical protein
MQLSSDLNGNPKASTGYLLVSGLYVWDHGNIRPFAMAGTGYYIIEPAEGGKSGRLGFHLGGGLEYFVSRRSAVTGQALLQFPGSVGESTSSFLGFHVGYRYHF